MIEQLDTLPDEDDRAFQELCASGVASVTYLGLSLVALFHPATDAHTAGVETVR